MSANTNVEVGSVPSQSSTIPLGERFNGTYGNHGGDASTDPSLAEQGQNDEQGVIEQQLLPVDGGPAAWKLLFGAFVFEALLWGTFCTLTQLKCLGITCLNRIPTLIRCLPGLLLRQ